MIKYAFNGKLDLRFYGSDTGFCRLYFKERETSRKYCLQEESGYGPNGLEFELYRCSEDWEPDYALNIQKNIKAIEIPDDLQCQLSVAIRGFLSGLPCEVQAATN